MTTRLLLFVTITAISTAPLWAQGGRGGPQNREAPVTPVPFDRILRAKGLADDLRWLFDVRVARANTAHRLEILCRQYVLACQLGEPALLTEEDWVDFHARIRNSSYAAKG